MLFFVSSYFKTVNAINDKVYNSIFVSIVIFTVNLPVLFCLRMKKSLNIKKLLRCKLFIRDQLSSLTKKFISFGVRIGPVQITLTTIMTEPIVVAQKSRVPKRMCLLSPVQIMSVTIVTVPIVVAQKSRVPKRMQYIYLSSNAL